MIHLLLLPPALVAIQDANRPPEPPRGGRMEGRGGMRDKMDPRILMRLQKNLKLTDAQVASMGKVMAAHITEMRVFNDKLRSLGPKMKAIETGGGSSAEKNVKLKSIVDEWFAIRYQRDTVSREKFEQDMRAGLEPMQQMRLVMGLERLRDEMKNRIQQRGPGRNDRNKGR